MSDNSANQNFNNDLQTYYTEYQQEAGAASAEQQAKTQKDESLSTTLFDTEMIGSPILDRIFKTKSFKYFNDWAVQNAQDPESLIGRPIAAIKNWFVDRGMDFLTKMGYDPDAPPGKMSAWMDAVKASGILPPDFTLKDFADLATNKGNARDRYAKYGMQRLDERTKKFQQKFNEKKQQLEDLRTQAETKFRNAQDEMLQKKAEIEGKIGDARTEAETRLSEAKQKLADARQELNERVDDVRQHVATQRQQLESEVRQNIEQGKSQLLDARAQAESQLQSARQQAESQVSDIRQQAETQLQSARTQAEGQVNEMRQQAQTQIEQGRAQVEGQFNEARQQAQAVRTDLETQARTGIQQAQAQLEQTRTQLQDQASQLQDQAQAVRTDLETQARTGIKQARSAVSQVSEDAQTQFQQARTQMRAAQTQMYEDVLASSRMTQERTISQFQSASQDLQRGLSDIRNTPFVQTDNEFDPLSERPSFRPIYRQVIEPTREGLSLLEQEGGSMTPNFLTRARNALGDFFTSNIKPSKSSLPATSRLAQATTVEAMPEMLLSREQQAISRMGTEASALVRRPATQFIQRATQPIRDIGERLLTDAPAEESLGSKLLSGAGSLLETGAEAGAGFGIMLGIGAGIGQIQNPEIRNDVNTVANTAMAADGLPGAGFLSRGLGAIKDWTSETFQRLTGGNPSPSQIPPQVEEAQPSAVQSTSETAPADTAEAPINEAPLQDTAQALQDATVQIQDTASSAVQAGTDAIGDVVSGVLDTATGALADATAAASEIPGIGEIIGTTFALSMLASAIFEGIKGGQEDSGPVDSTLPSFQSGI